MRMRLCAFPHGNQRALALHIVDPIYHCPKRLMQMQILNISLNYVQAHRPLT